MSILLFDLGRRCARARLALLGLDGAHVVDLIELLHHVALCLISFLQSVQQLRLLLLQLLRRLLGAECVVVPVLHAVHVGLVQVHQVALVHVVEVRLRPLFLLLHVLERPLFFLQKVVAIAEELVVDSPLLVLELEVGVPIALERPLHVGHDAALGVHALAVELVSVGVLRVVHGLPEGVLRLHAERLLVVHILDEFLPPLQVVDSLVGPVLLPPQLDDAVLDLGLLVLHFLRLHDRVHHRVVRFYTYYGCVSSRQILILFFNLFWSNC